MKVGANDAVFRNPAWMSAEEGFKVRFGRILFMPDVKTKVQGLFANPNFDFNGYSFNVKSDADMFTIPEIAIVNKINDSLTFGIGAFGVSGMGVDYRKYRITANQVYPIDYTNFQFMRIIPAISYKVMPGLSVGVGIDLAWGFS